MAKIVQLEQINSIKMGVGSTVLSDGTIVNPESYSAVNITLDDGRTFQVERPLTLVKLQAAIAAVPGPVTVDALSEGQILP